MGDTIHLEAFSEHLRKQKIYCVGDIQSLDKMFNVLYTTYNEEVLRRNKVIVIFSDNYLKHNPKFLKNIYCDVIFRIKETRDLQLAYTYIQHCNKPLYIIWYTNEIPPVLFNSINSSKDDITLVAGGINPPKQAYSAVFWSTKSSYDDVNSFLGIRMKDLDTKTIFNETKGSEVSLVWCSNGEIDKRGTLCWFDFNSSNGMAPSINYAHASEYLRTLADALELKN